MWAPFPALSRCLPLESEKEALSLEMVFMVATGGKSESKATRDGGKRKEERKLDMFLESHADFIPPARAGGTRKPVSASQSYVWALPPFLAQRPLRLHLSRFCQDRFTTEPRVPGAARPFSTLAAGHGGREQPPKLSETVRIVPASPGPRGPRAPTGPIPTGPH